VHQDIGDARIVLLNSAFDCVRDLMAFPHGNVAVDLDVKIDIETETHFADKTFVDPDDAGN
jgi:hypothetical protein